MKTLATMTVVAAMLSGPLVAQENKPVPKNSVRVFVPGCSKGYIFTAARRTEDEPGSVGIPEGMHLRMNGPKKAIEAIDAYKGSMLEITGLMKKGQLQPDGVRVGGGVRLMPAPSPGSGGIGSAPMASPIQIDVEGWNPSTGTCAPS